MSDKTRWLHDLGARIAEEQDAALTRASHLTTAQSRLEESESTRSQHHPRWRTRWTIASVAVAAAAVAVVSADWIADPQALVLVGRERTPQRIGAWISSPARERLPLRFSDGSQVWLGPNAKARVVDVKHHGAHLLVESGSAQVDVLPNKHNQWRLSFGPFLVEVIGTKFTVDWNPEEDSFRLTLQKGRVRVSGCVLGEGRVLLPGDTLDASCKDARFEISSGTAKSSSQAKPSETASIGQAAPLADEAEPVRTPTARQAPVALPKPDSVADWRELARSSDYKAAFAMATSSGFEAECARGNAQDLLLLADSARFSGNVRQADHAYRRTRERFPGTPEASRAAFSLARQAFDQRGAYAEAARWFEIYLQEQPNGGFAREALGRWMESLQRSGDRVRARQAAQRYLAKYPNGPHAVVAKQLVADR